MYRGEYSGSWPEMADMAGFADKLTVSQIMELFIDCHSCSQLLITPYGYNCVDFPETNGRHISLIEAIAGAIYAVHETNYTFSPGCETLYPTNGES
jgi:carboxypeptidase A4